MASPSREAPFVSRRLSFWIGGALILAFWAASMLWLLADLGRGPLLTRAASYGALVPAEALRLTYAITAGGRSVGELSYRVEPEDAGRRIEWRMKIGMQAGSASVPVTVEGNSFLDSAGAVRSFAATMALGPQPFEVEGTRSDDVLTVRFKGFGVSQARVFQVDSTLAVGDGLFPGLIAGCPRRGERLTWNAFDPLTMTSTEVSLERTRGSVDPPAPPGGCVASVTYKGLKTLLWIDEDGIVIRQRTPVGWELVLQSDPRAETGGSTDL